MGEVEGEKFSFFFQAEDGIRDLVRSRGLGDVYKRQPQACAYAIERVIIHLRDAKQGSTNHQISLRLWGLSLIHI